MADPYETMGLTRSSSDAEIRRRYLELVRQFPRVVRRPDVRINPRDPNCYPVAGEPSGYGLFPYVVRCANGDLLTIFREGIAHIFSPEGRLVAARSTEHEIVADSRIEGVAVEAAFQPIGTQGAVDRVAAIVAEQPRRPS